MALNDTLNNSTLTDKMPVLFVGHGNPMNAITDNSYSQRWKNIGEQLPVPNAILCISAHWDMVITGDYWKQHQIAKSSQPAFDAIINKKIIRLKQKYTTEFKVVPLNDQGSQYGSDCHRKLFKRYGIQQSMAIYLM
jgi:hypothetical protein